VRAPTLVLHRQSEEQMPVEVSRRLAERLPDGRLVELAGTTPTLFIEDQATDLQLVTGFVVDGRAGPAKKGLAKEGPTRTSLTPRERDVLRLLPSGDSNAEIARRLGIAVHTVERHLAGLYRKIGARGRADAVAYALTENPHNI
jgi:DNA-binding CsgD family transcriptional regulator